ncbi:uncharacterized protein ASCRUDRAFT_95194 [Ascoidea rubescens DSM 1968]|uniref:Uncharacterized protein n=1 Tax=Ascoidea rubescens DSM 1968 TaxID=1344418 RepID=A0A1D2VP74_9ASCO|nr:hypothetical protein ASCRUDRAFT_95194 [Ascoidea rubescens DSM 1968]ODV63411.1 hypothetical protein ASCRUDRAFT_95194 [Ascoidea rubescens DSM 1968]
MIHDLLFHTNNLKHQHSTSKSNYKTLANNNNLESVYSTYYLQKKLSDLKQNTQHHKELFCYHLFGLISFLIFNNTITLTLV